MGPLSDAIETRVAGDAHTHLIGTDIIRCLVLKVKAYLNIVFGRPIDFLNFQHVHEVVYKLITF